MSLSTIPDRGPLAAVREQISNQPLPILAPVNATDATKASSAARATDSEISHFLSQFFTRKQALGKLIELGFPLTESYWNKLNLPSVGAGPPVARWWGKRPLYLLSDLIAWAESRSSTTRSKLVA